MYNVSESYLTAMKSKIRSDSISGSVTLSDGTAIAISDSNIVRDSVRITKDICGASYRIGTFCLACLQITFIDPEGAVRDYSGAVIELTYTLESAGEGENIPLGRYIMDGTAVKRVKNLVTLTAYDNGLLFDTAPSAAIRDMEATPHALISAACGQCGVALATTSAEIAKMPNSGTNFSPKSAQIQSCRDLVMWCADVLCAYAVIDRDGALKIIPAKYMVSSSDPTDIIIDRYLNEEERKSISVTDTRAYIKYLTGYSEGKVKAYTSSHNDSDEQAYPAAYEMRSNPLLSGKSESECDAVNESFLAYIDAFKQRGVSAVTYGDPAIDIGDTIRFRGGDIDQRRSIVGLVTGIDWRYRGYCTLTCKAAVCCYDPPNAAAQMLSCSKSQTEKRIDALEAEKEEGTETPSQGSGGTSSGGGGLTIIKENFGNRVENEPNTGFYDYDVTATVPTWYNGKKLVGIVIHGYLYPSGTVSGYGKPQYIEWSKFFQSEGLDPTNTDYTWPTMLVEVIGSWKYAAMPYLSDGIMQWKPTKSSDSVNTTFKIWYQQYGYDRTVYWSMDALYS